MTEPLTPIGVFDSGMGGLTVLRAPETALPAESFIYLGDTARLPYGSKSPATVERYALQAAEILVVLILAFFGGMALAAAGGAWLGAWLFNRTLTGILKRRGFGDDTVLKSAVQYHADSNLPLLFGTYAPNEAWRPLPDDFDAVMKPMLDAQTSASLVKLREALAISMTTDGASILDSVKQSFTGSELVHTNYFAHPDFAPFLAFLLVEHHGFPPSRRYSEIDAAKYADWFTAIRAADHVSRVEWAKQQGRADPFSGQARVTPSS